MNDLIKQIEEHEIRTPVSRWTGNDASQRRHTGLLNLSHSRDFILQWKRSPSHQPKLVGVFRLQLERLISDGFCKKEGHKARVTFHHDSDGFIRLRCGSAGGIVIAKI